MPALLWVAFWSSLMAAATCFGQIPRAVPVYKRDPADRRDG